MAGALILGACGGDDDGDTAASESAADAADEMTLDGSDQMAGDGGGFLATGDAAPEQAEDDPTEGGFDIGVVGRDVIIEMRVVLSSDDIQRTVASVMASASTLGGGVASSDVNYGNSDDNDGFAVLVVKVPPTAVDRLLAGLDDTGTVQSINQSAQDVTEQLVDLDVRLANARTSVDNVRQFMERTENLNDLVSLEAELTRRQTSLEQLEAQQRNIADRVALSTITIEVVPTASVPDVTTDDDTIGDAFRSGWDAFAAFMFGIGFVVAATLPFLLLGLVFVLVAWMGIRRRDRRTPSRSGTLAAPSVPSADRAPIQDEPGADDGEQADDCEPEPVH